MAPQLYSEPLILDRIPLFRGLEDQLIARALVGSQVLVHHASDKLFSAGEKSDYFGFVIDGAYKLCMSDKNGEEVIFHFGTMGEALGIMSVMTCEAVFPFQAVSLGTSRFLKIPKTTFVQEWKQIPELLFRFQSDLQGRIFRAHEEKRQQRLELPQKVADLLLFLSDYKSPSAGQISFPLTRKDLASYVGSSIESMIRLLSDWTNRKIITTNQRYIQILDRQALENILTKSEIDVFSSNKQHQFLNQLWSKTSLNSAGLSK